MNDRNCIVTCLCCWIPRLYSVICTVYINCREFAARFRDN